MKIKYYFLPLLCFLLACQKETITPTETPNNPASTVESPPIDQRLITQLNNTLVPLSYTNPLIWTAEDLSYFDKLADKKIVGLGEATHGTSEFFKAKFKIFKYLVEHHNYKVFAFEADVGESIYINQAILEGRVESIRNLMSNYMIFWTWQTEEVLELLEWMATYNQDKPEEDKIHYVGVDCQSNRYNEYWVRTYFQEYDRELLELAEPVIQQIARKTEEYYQEGAVVDESEYQELLETHSDLVRSFKRKESQLIEASSLKAYQLQSRMLEVMRQSFEVSYNYTR